MRSLNVDIVTCQPRQHVKMWHKLERGLLLVFKDTFGSIPFCNTQGKNIKKTNEFNYFRRPRLQTVIEDLS